MESQDGERPVDHIVSLRVKQLVPGNLRGSGLGWSEREARALRNRVEAREGEECGI